MSPAAEPSTVRARMCSVDSGADITEVDINLPFVPSGVDSIHPLLPSKQLTRMQPTKYIPFLVSRPAASPCSMLFLHFHLLPRIQNSNIKISFTGKLQYLRKYIYGGERGVTG